MKPDINKVRVGLEHCSAPDTCLFCPYLKREEGQQCCGMYAEALALLDGLEAARATLAEIDKYVNDLDEYVCELKEEIGPWPRKQRSS